MTFLKSHNNLHIKKAAFSLQKREWLSSQDLLAASFRHRRSVLSFAFIIIAFLVLISSNIYASDYITRTVPDDKRIKVSSNDTTAGFLNGKLIAGTSITFTENADGANETLAIASNALTGETDTLDSVSDRGGTTPNILEVGGIGAAGTISGNTVSGNTINNAGEYTLPQNKASSGQTVVFQTGGTTIWQTAGGVAAPIDASYVTLGLNGTLSAERVLTGTANQITVTDGGANGNVTLATPQDIHTGASPTFANLILTAGGDIRPSADSTTALNIAQADGTDFTIFDTTNKFVGIGGTPDAFFHLQTAVDGDAILGIIENTTAADTGTNETAQLRFAFGGDNDVGRISVAKVSNYTTALLSNSKMSFWVDSEGTAIEGVIIKTTASFKGVQFGINITPTSTFHMVNLEQTGVGANPNITAAFTTYSTADNPSQITFLKSNSDTIGTNTVTNNNNILGRFVAAGVESGGFSGFTACQIDFIQDAAAGSFSVPGRLALMTTKVGDITPTERLTLKNTGDVGINTSSPGAHLDINPVTRTTGTIFTIDYNSAKTLTGSLIGANINLATNITPGSNAITGLYLTIDNTTRADTAAEGAIVIASIATLERMIDCAVANTGQATGLWTLRWGTAATLAASTTMLLLDGNTNVTGGSQIFQGIILKTPAAITSASFGARFDWRGTAGTAVNNGIINIEVGAATTLTEQLVGIETDLTTNVTSGANAVMGHRILIDNTTRANTAGEAALVLDSQATAARIFDAAIANTSGTPFILRYRAATTPAPVVMATIDLSTNVTSNVNANIGLDIPIVAADEDTTAPLRMNTMRMFVGTGVPINANGTDGDEYHRIDGGVATSIYKRIAGVWTAIA